MVLTGQSDIFSASQTLPPYFVILKTKVFDEDGEDETHGSYTCKRQEDRHK